MSSGNESIPLEKVVVHPLVLLRVVDHFNRMKQVGNTRRVVDDCWARSESKSSIFPTALPVKLNCSFNIKKIKLSLGIKKQVGVIFLNSDLSIFNLFDKYQI